jgi:DNA-directed RNA polymerase specialized sigma24 family protein
MAASEQTHSDGFFRTTRWSLISEIKDPNSTQSKTILNALFQDYWKPVYCYIKRKGSDDENAKDLTQEFFYKILFEKNLFAKAQKSKGKFRSFLLAALNNFLISENRYKNSQKRTSGREIPILELIDLIPSSDSHYESEEDIFNCAWVSSLLDNVSNKVKEQFSSKGSDLHWIAFDKRVRKPILKETPVPSLADICKTCGIEDEVKASNMITTVKRCFQKTLRNHIREYVYSDTEVDHELSELMIFLQKYVQDKK